LDIGTVAGNYTGVAGEDAVAREKHGRWHWLKTFAGRASLSDPEGNGKSCRHPPDSGAPATPVRAAASGDLGVGSNGWTGSESGPPLPPSRGFQVHPTGNLAPRAGVMSLRWINRRERQQHSPGLSIISWVDYFQIA
jgi:hypothetical protein